MGCCYSSPHSLRKYRDPADLDEEYVDEDGNPIRTFGTLFRNSSVVIPDDIPGLPSTHYLGPHLATDTDTLLYDAEIDNGRAWRCVRFANLLWVCPCAWVYVISSGIGKMLKYFTCDEACLFTRKEYSTRTFFRVYPNRIELNNPYARYPWGLFGCGSWNADAVVSHPFDRGAFGFRKVRYGVINYLCLIWPVYGDAVARQRCPCNGPLWRGGWWCEEWPCDMLFCTYRYYGIADGDETAFASSLALQAYFEGRKISREDMDKCLEYWRENISEMANPVDHKRPVMCEPFSCPFPQGARLYKCICQMKRTIPYKSDDLRTEELQEIYDQYDENRTKQLKRYVEFKGPVQNSTFCKCLGCRRCMGRKGVIFCTEGCCDTAGCCYSDLEAQPGDPFVPFAHADIDDDNDASKVLQSVLGNPPSNVVYKRWEKDEETGKFTAVVTRSEKEKAKADVVSPLAEENETTTSTSLVQRFYSGRAPQSSDKPDQLTGEALSKMQGGDSLSSKMK
mmetsp:Transcript_26970/g.58481  ORF Transcript_26970/g.58481 Transcript_26970/m.58481 type:complete len:507 (+) Transcript_26970:93-1613(+)